MVQYAADRCKVLYTASAAHYRCPLSPILSVQVKGSGQSLLIMMNAPNGWASFVRCHLHTPLILTPPEFHDPSSQSLGGPHTANNIKLLFTQIYIDIRIHRSVWVFIPHTLQKPSGTPLYQLPFYSSLKVIGLCVWCNTVVMLLSPICSN